jgi:hypothetical protein
MNYLVWTQFTGNVPSTYPAGGLSISASGKTRIVRSDALPVGVGVLMMGGIPCGCTIF